MYLSTFIFSLWWLWELHQWKVELQWRNEFLYLPLIMIMVCTFCLFWGLFFKELFYFSVRIDFFEFRRVSGSWELFRRHLNQQRCIIQTGYTRHQKFRVVREMSYSIRSKQNHTVCLMKLFKKKKIWIYPVCPSKMTGYKHHTHF